MPRAGASRSRESSVGVRTGRTSPMVQGLYGVQAWLCLLWKREAGSTSVGTRDDPSQDSVGRCTTYWKRPMHFGTTGTRA